MHKPKPFGRALSIVAAISAAYAAFSGAALVDALCNIPAYRSRGKGGKYRAWSNSGIRHHCNNGGKGYAHQGAQEMARRVRQGLAA